MGSCGNLRGVCVCDSRPAPPEFPGAEKTARTVQATSYKLQAPSTARDGWLSSSLTRLFFSCGSAQVIGLATTLSSFCQAAVEAPPAPVSKTPARAKKRGDLHRPFADKLGHCSTESGTRNLMTYRATVRPYIRLTSSPVQSSPWLPSLGTNLEPCCLVCCFLSWIWLIKR